MLFSVNPEDIILACNILSHQRGSTEDIQNTNKLLMVLMRASGRLSRIVYGPETSIKHGMALELLNRVFCTLADDANIDPIGEILDKEVDTAL